MGIMFLDVNKNPRHGIVTVKDFVQFGTPTIDTIRTGLKPLSPAARFLKPDGFKSSRVVLIVYPSPIHDCPRITQAAPDLLTKRFGSDSTRTRGPGPGDGGRVPGRRRIPKFESWPGEA
eukprot:738930-Hanusia_phi.AAC.1